MMKKQFHRMKQLAAPGKAQDATDLLSEDLVQVEQRVEPAKKAAQIVHKKLIGCLQGQQGLDTEKRMKKLPLLSLSVSMAESCKDFDGDSSIRRVLEMCCYIEKTLAKALADFEVQVEKEVLEPLNKLSEDDLPEILRNKKLFAKLTTDWISAKNRSSSGGQEEVEETWRKLEQVKDIYSADLYHFATKEDDYANYFIRLLELQAQYHKKSFEILDPMITELKENSNITTSQVSSPSLGVYGVSLATHLRTSSREIALPIEECVKMLLVKGMREEGLFRLAAAASVVKKLKAGLDCGNIDPTEFYSDPHAVAGALKSYLREMPQPMMTFELYNDWFKAASEKDQQKKLEGFQELCCKLPRENYNNLRYLVKFLAKLAELQEVNKMSPSNIAIVLGPNLLWPQNEGETLMLDMATASSVQVVKVIEPLVQFADRLFPGDVDFDIPVCPSVPTAVEKALPPPQKKTVEEPTVQTAPPTGRGCTAPDSPPKLKSSLRVSTSAPVIIKSGSVARRTSLWDNMNQNQNQNRGEETQAVQTPAPETQPPPHPAPKAGEPCKGPNLRCCLKILQQTNPLIRLLGPAAKKPANHRPAITQAPACELTSKSMNQNKPQAQVNTPSQRESCASKPNPSLHAQASSQRKAGGQKRVKGGLRVPNFPPPLPPQQPIKEQLSSSSK
ncbi:SH3 domain-binding protein 1 isoform X1 [Acipenser ruthenus]|uniref:SH3 domain-binding protein 1 isoform X1 n=1 Tax=Acipenser ruthenus TaxID=7906 RepID=UPI002740955B|nr:SH3 domain-binding protein 1 isoform X1 [Acipenser ruthenus]